jgi:hypothetical protein
MKKSRNVTLVDQYAKLMKVLRTMITVKCSYVARQRTTNDVHKTEEAHRDMKNRAVSQVCAVGCKLDYTCRMFTLTLRNAMDLLEVRLWKLREQNCGRFN